MPQSHEALRFVEPHISYNEFKVGQQLSFICNTLHPDGSIVKQNDRINIQTIQGSGFFGKVLLPKDRDYVIKTSLPDAWHHLWRIVNWNFRQFPAQYEESMAQLEHLGTRIIHAALPVVTENRFYCPDSLGFAILPTGYAQIIEKIEGRPPNFENGMKEFHDFRQAQEELAEIAYNLGLEQVAQIHPNNPFGMANLWLDEERHRWIWLDTIPAIPHKGWVYPFFHFKFHQEVKQLLNEGNLSFNRIHTNKFRSYLMKHKEMFGNHQYLQLITDLNLYERIWQQNLKEHKNSSEILSAVHALTALALQSAPIPLRILKNALISPLRITFDPKYRIDAVLKGMYKAREGGLISEAELHNAIEVLELHKENSTGFNREMQVLTALYISYAISSLIINSLEYSIAGISIVGQNVDVAGLSIFIGEVLPVLMRPLLTLALGELTNSDLKAAAMVSWPPKIGPNLAIPAQLAFSTGGKTKQIWHYTVRNIISGLSGIFPSGGMGSQLEAELWERLGMKIEQLAKQDT